MYNVILKYIFNYIISSAATTTTKDQKIIKKKNKTNLIDF